MVGPLIIPQALFSFSFELRSSKTSLKVEDALLYLGCRCTRCRFGYSRQVLLASRFRMVSVTARIAASRPPVPMCASTSSTSSQFYFASWAWQAREHFLAASATGLGKYLLRCTRPCICVRGPRSLYSQLVDNAAREAKREEKEKEKRKRMRKVRVVSVNA